jgi:hypothetical protein
MPNLTLSTAMDAFLAQTPSDAQKLTVREVIDAEKDVPITTVTAVAAYEVSVPSGTPTAGDRVKLYITASGADRDLTFAAGIRIPSDSAVTFPKTLTSGETYIVQLEYLGSFWMLTTIVGGGAA